MSYNWKIYKITSITTKLSYIGQTRSSLKQRCRKHFQGALRNKNKLFTDFAKAIRELGKENFTQEILEENIPTQELANVAEIYWIEFYDTFNNGYNMTTGGQEFIDIRFSDEMREKISIANTGRPLSDEHKKSISIANKGRKLSSEHKQKLSDAHRGKPTGRKGIKFTEEHKQNIAKSQRGKKLSEEHKKKISEHSAHKKHTEEFKEYLRKINLGENNPNHKSKKDNKNININDINIENKII